MPEPEWCTVSRDGRVIFTGDRESARKFGAEHNADMVCLASDVMEPATDIEFDVTYGDDTGRQLEALELLLGSDIKKNGERVSVELRERVNAKYVKGGAE